MLRVTCTCLLTASLAGCFAEVLTATAVQGQLQATQLKSAKKQIERAQGFSAETELTQAIRAYQADKGANPPSLEALAPEFLPSIPVKPDGSPYGYDPATGSLLDKPLSIAPALTPADWAKLDQIRAAVQQYGADVTWYPVTLADLVPKYLPLYPLTEDGREYIYDNQTGQVYAPGNAPATPSTAPRPIGGGGPSHEAATAIGMQQELGNMNSEGANAARNRASGQQVGGAYSDKQMQTLDNLGL